MGCLIYGAIVLGLARAHVPVGVIIHDSKVTPVLWNSTVTLDRQNEARLAVCRRGNPEDCTEGLSKYSDGRVQPHKCDILSPNCQCHQWVFLEPPARSDGVTTKRSAEEPSCVVVTVPPELAEVSLALEFRLQRHSHRFITPGVQTALESVWRALPVRGDVSKSLFVASEARGFCDRQEIDIAVPGCDDYPPFLVNIRRAGSPDTFPLAWPTWVPAISALAVLVAALYLDRDTGI